ncbi:aminotransferase class I/II-fold pyridoxal phosphate-dependent enzyme [Oceaniglobus indicus]|uniref:aminotransferase class I/II-fold pyridoxal phosphate-dependent enzyme n=1 Tax=Oceaniglobus indicus TaxID=2047749 RepID=UPI000C19A3C6|nr:aminotransferase class I/II-fold pyridoxal phosphate-dependent enzyme [Oceaniglobus indicus]
MTGATRDHGGGIDAAAARWGGARAQWIDLSTGINPSPYPLPSLPPEAWNALPDHGAQTALEDAARRFWQVPDTASVLAAPGASALIAQLPHALCGDRVAIRPDTYNEHAAAFRTAGWQVDDTPATPGAPLRVVVHPNNPTGEYCDPAMPGPLIVDESFCDTAPARSLVARAGTGVTVLKSFGKFWGLAGLRLGFAIGAPALIDRLRERLGPWPVAGPALAIGTAALRDHAWAARTRDTLHREAAILDTMLSDVGLTGTGDCPLFRLIETRDAQAWHGALAERHVLTRVFPYAPGWLRVGLPASHHRDHLGDALNAARGAIDGTVGGAMAQPSAARRP